MSNNKNSKDEMYIVIENKNKNKKNNNSKSKKAKKKSKNRTAMKVVVSLLLICIIISTCYVGYMIQNNGGGLKGLLATALGESKESLENVEPIQILILGISGEENYKLADSIMIASYNPKTQTAGLVSVPRDTYVGKKDRKSASQNYIASYKINSVYRNGTNLPDMIERINDITGLDLENYVVIDTKALIKLVDAIGGVEFDVPIDMKYDDSSQNLKIDLKKGEQLITGEKAEQLLRFRHNNDGSTYPSSYGQQDLGRMRTQREFVTATLKQTLKPQNIFKLKQILDIMNENIDTNLDIAQLKKYIPHAVEFDAENLKTGMLPGNTETCNGVSIYVTQKSKTTEFVSEMFDFLNDEGEIGSTATEESVSKSSANESSNSESKEKNIKLELLNASGNEDLLEDLKIRLKEEGYTIKKQGNINTVQNTCIINRTNVSSDIIKDLKDVIATSNQVKGTDTSSVDVTIIIGKDYK